MSDKPKNEMTPTVGNKRQTRTKVHIAVLALALVVIAATIIAVVCRDADTRPFHAEFARRDTVYVPETTESKDTSDETDTESTASDIPTVDTGAFFCRLGTDKTEWSADETPTLSLDFGLLNDSYGKGALRLRLVGEHLATDDDIYIEDYIFDIHPYEGKNTSDHAQIALHSTLAADEYAWGRLYISFEFIPDADNETFGDDILRGYYWDDDYYDYDYDDDDDDTDYTDAYGIWIGGYGFSYAVTPAGIRLSRRTVAPADFFAETVIKQYKSKRLNTDEFCRAYYKLLYTEGGTYLSATSPISDGSTLVGYFSPTLRATAYEAVRDRELVALVSQAGPFSSTHDDELTISRADGRELAGEILAVLCRQGVITEEEYTDELESLNAAVSFATSPPELIKSFKKYRKTLEASLYTHE